MIFFMDLLSRWRGVSSSKLSFDVLSVRISNSISFPVTLRHDLSDVDGSKRKGCRVPGKVNINFFGSP